VVALAFDPGAEPLAASPLAAAAWAQAIGRGLDKPLAGPPGATVIPGPSPVPDDLFPPTADAPLPSPLLLGLLLLAYLLVVGPLNLVLSRRWRKPDLLWVTTPLIAVFCAATFYVVGGTLQGGNRDQEVQVLKVAPRGVVADLEYHQILFNQRGEHRIGLPAGTLVAPMTLSLFLSTGSDCQRCVLQLSGLPQDVEEHVLNSVQPEVLERGVAYGNVRVVGAASTLQARLGAETHLAATGGRVTGTIANRGPGPLREVALYTYDGEVYHRTPLAPQVLPGATLTVDSVPQPIDASAGAARPGAGQAADDRALEDAVGRNALNQRAAPVLLAFVDPVPSALSVDGSPPERSGRALLEQGVDLEFGDSLLGDFHDIRLAAGSGDQRSGYLDVYDVALPPRLAGTPQITFDPAQYTSLQVYDWTTGSWRGADWPKASLDSSKRVVSLGAADLRDGLVRVRVKEARLSWGGFLTLGMAGGGGS
jgi:hypothetical protein